ncbi:hypothetical protein A9P82_05810 [Arachidicoccus ginsenosidimutans]|nr:hypothetical protein A9P82_05810 [Arachidicoccus sp. BS20]
MEMHDNIGQVLCMVHMMLKDALRKQPSGGIPEALIAQSAELLNQSIEDIRKLSYIFSGKMVEDTSITNALETELSYIQSLYKIPCRFVHSIDKSISLPASNRTLLLFRIAQEALQNAVKHSQATGIQCTLNMDSRRLQLSIEDNGRGMNVCRTAKGMGLKNMRERAMLLNGTFDIISAPGQGCRVVVCIENTGA